MWLLRLICTFLFPSGELFSSLFRSLMSQERPCSVVHLSGTGGRAGGAVCFPNPPLWVPHFKEIRFSLGLYNQALVVQIFLERTFPVQADIFD